MLTRAHAALGAPAQLARPQEALQHFLSSWHEALAHMSRTHQDIPAATEQLKTLRQTFTAHLVPTFAPGGPREHTRPRELPADAATPPPPPPPPAAAAAAAAPALVYLLALLLCLVSLLRPRLLTPTVTEQEELDAASRAVDDAAANPVRSHARRVHTGRAQRAHCLPADDSAFWRACACCQRWSPGTCRDQVALAPALSGSARVHVRSTRLAPGARKGAVKGPPG